MKQQITVEKKKDRKGRMSNQLQLWKEMIARSKKNEIIENCTRMGKLRQKSWKFQRTKRNKPTAQEKFPRQVYLKKKKNETFCTI